MFKVKLILKLNITNMNKKPNNDEDKKLKM